MDRANTPRRRRAQFKAWAYLALFGPGDGADDPADDPSSDTGGDGDRTGRETPEDR
jgi:hypothetical protein